MNLFFKPHKQLADSDPLMIQTLDLPCISGERKYAQYIELHSKSNLSLQQFTHNAYNMGGLTWGTVKRIHIKSKPVISRVYCSKNATHYFIRYNRRFTDFLLFVSTVQVLTIYRPHNRNEKLSLQELDFLMKNLPSQNVTITGDFNTDLLYPSSSGRLNKIFEYGTIFVDEIWTFSEMVPFLLRNFRSFLK